MHLIVYCILLVGFLFPGLLLGVCKQAVIVMVFAVLRVVGGRGRVKYTQIDLQLCRPKVELNPILKLTVKLHCLQTIPTQKSLFIRNISLDVKGTVTVLAHCRI